MNNHTNHQLNQLLTHFSVAKKTYSFSPLTDGFINDTFLVLDGNDPLYILQRINHKVFTNINGLMNNIHDAFEHLNDTDYQKITLVPSLEGQSYYTNKGAEPSYWRVMTYIKDSTAHNTTKNTDVAFEAGKIIAKFNILLEKAEANNYVDTIPQFHDLQLRENQFNVALAQASKEKLKIAEEAITFSNEVLNLLHEVNLNHLPIRVCHNDTKLNNILFSKSTNKALCLIDLDTLMRGKFLFDFGDAVRTIVNTAPEDEQNHEKITFEKELFEAFISGLAANGPFLSKEEIETLHWGAILMPFLHGIRALTDYLNGNIYYKVAYENQNYDRSLSLFNFTKKALAQTSFMQKIIAKNLASKS
ncbi:phosphotransferase enzyme family protein [Euzebyella saccharophila]|uniref:Phosphotransferase enzyme family protein n=1 Tax=Euzebyella saccharophila TaxID=679664 RepID=A0ABV8JPY6_9FLAO|nr:aminoglycoside phosphotransferase family protein [Euzebyella saccharophila]